MVRHDVVSWTTLILGYVENGESSVALDVFVGMDCLPDSVTFIAALKACAGLTRQSDKKACLETGMAIHKQAREYGFEKDIFVACTLVEMYRKCGSMKDARDFFQRITEHDVVLWSALILGYVENGENFLACSQTEKKLCLENGMVIHRQAREHGCDEHVYVSNALVDMYSKCGSMKDARSVFKRMTHHDVLSWNSLMIGYVENGECLVALDMFVNMDCKPDGFAFAAALKACSGYLEKGMAVHRRARECELDKDVFVASTLVEMYSKFGSMQDARDVFERMIQRDVVSWTALILGYVENGECSLALDLFNSMDRLPNSFTVVAALKACAGLANEKQSDKKASLEIAMVIHKLARELRFDKHVVVGNTLVDMYRKCGSMRDARVVFENMLDHDVVSWTALILRYVENGECTGYKKRYHL